jgi:hypothetical protein
VPVNAPADGPGASACELNRKSSWRWARRKKHKNMNVVYKIERNSHRSKFYVIRKFLYHKQPQNFHIEDSNLGIVSNLLSYTDAKVSCDRFNREHVEA